MEAKGYNFENANATLHLLYAKTLGDELNYFDLVNWRAFVTGESGNVRAECSVKLMVNQETLILPAIRIKTVKSVSSVPRK